MDPLSDVLRAIRLTGAHFFLAECAPPWSVSAAAARTRVPRILPQAEHLMSYHVLLEGTCWAAMDDAAPVRMQAGDVIVFPHGDAHRMSSREGEVVFPEPNPYAPDRYPHCALLGTGPVESTLLCGFFGCDSRPFNPLIDVLPRMLYMPRAEDGWLAAFPEQTMREWRAGRAGNETLITRMAELMFIEVVRRHIESLETGNVGWLAGLADPVVGVALARLHERPAHHWTLPDLAREVAASRSVLAERFTQLVGVPPMQYLAQWRLQLAAEKLASSSAKVAAIGAEVGYESEAAFSRAFKRATGESPAAWRAQRRS